LENRIFPWHEIVFRSVVLRAEQIPHALLLHGREGTGKLQFALTLAQFLVCENPAATGPCGACPACVWFKQSSHPDFRRIEPGAKGTEDEKSDEPKDNAQIIVDQVRALDDFLNLSTHRGGRRVVLLHPAERLNIHAANALLKSLEEPPPRTVFLLLSHRPHHLLATIKSRCQMIALAGPTHAVAAAWLNSQGVADADLAAAHTGDAPLLALELAAADYWQPRANFLRHLDNVDLDPIETAEKFCDYPIAHVLAWLQKWSYDLASQKLIGRIRYNPDHESVLASLARRLEPLPVLRFHREMVRLQRSIRHPLNARLFMESMLLSYADLVNYAAPLRHVR
jgi:DNA polymerase III subunit delta'